MGGKKFEKRGKILKGISFKVVKNGNTTNHIVNVFNWSHLVNFLVAFMMSAL